MADKMSQLEVEAYDYVQVLTGKDSIMTTNKQTSVRLGINNLASVDALAELGKRSRNQIINDALAFGLQLIIEQFGTEEDGQFKELFMKHAIKLSNEEEPEPKRKEKNREVKKDEE
jgi:hypothetical protein